jgi:predicted PurR-regulated permease PerM
MLAASTGSTVAAFLGGYLLIVVVWWLIKRRDLYGRGRPMGCLIGLVVFFGLFVAAVGAVLARHVF